MSDLPPCRPSRGATRLSVEHCRHAWHRQHRCPLVSLDGWIAALSVLSLAEESRFHPDVRRRPALACAGQADSVEVAMLFLAALGVPFAWRKCSGGACVSWGSVLTGWTKRVLAEGKVNMSDFPSVLGWLSFAFAAVEPLPPFLGRWAAAASIRLELP